MRDGCATASTRTTRGGAGGSVSAGEEVADRINRDVVPSGFNHVSLALADAAPPRAWAGTEIPGLPTLSEQVRLIADRVIPLIAG
jgi:5,10-methylenetetrahydromethanopterin reductase